MQTLSLWDETLVRPADRSHLLLFAESPATLSSAAGLYLSDGLLRGESALVLATRTLSLDLRSELERRGLAPARLQEEGRLVVMDAREFLDAVLRNRTPDLELFRSAVNSIFFGFQSRGCSSARVYTEPASLLWRNGNVEAALRLEELWSELGQSQRFKLLCSYDGGFLEPEFHGSTAQRICQQHSHLVPTGDYDRLTAAVDQAMDDVFGHHAAALRPIISASRHRLEVHPGAQSALLWVRSHLPGRLDDVLASARRLYPQESAALPGDRHV